MKNLKSALDFLSRNLLLSLRWIAEWSHRLFGWSKRHPTQVILILLAIVAAWYSARTYHLNVRQADEAARTDFVLDAHLDFGNIFFSGFDRVSVFRSKLNWEDPWPVDAADLGDFRFYGLRPLVGATLLNNSKHAISVSFVAGRLSLGDYTAPGDRWSEYFTQRLQERKRFPLYLQPQEERIVFLPLTWPVTETVVEWLPGLASDSLYTARYLLKEYLRRKHTLLAGSGAHGALMRDVLIADLREQVESDTSTCAKIVLLARLSTGQDFWTTITVP